MSLGACPKDRKRLAACKNAQKREAIYLRLALWLVRICLKCDPQKASCPWRFGRRRGEM
jgi:hypothetical protein